MNRLDIILNYILNILCCIMVVVLTLTIISAVFFAGLKIISPLFKNKQTIPESRFVDQNGEDISKDITVIIDTKTGVSYMMYSNASHSDIVVLLNKDGKPLISEVQTND